MEKRRPATSSSGEVQIRSAVLNLRLETPDRGQAPLDLRPEMMNRGPTVVEVGAAEEPAAIQAEVD